MNENPANAKFCKADEFRPSLPRLNRRNAGSVLMLEIAFIFVAESSIVAEPLNFDRLYAYFSKVPSVHRRI